MVEAARTIFEIGESDEFKQGLGWYWILQADLGNAKMVDLQAESVLDAANQALVLLTPLENWPGIACAYTARAQAYEDLGDGAAAAADRQKQKEYEGKAVSSDTSTS